MRRSSEKSRRRSQAARISFRQDRESDEPKDEKFDSQIKHSSDSTTPPLFVMRIGSVESCRRCISAGNQLQSFRYICRTLYLRQAASDWMTDKRSFFVDQLRLTRIDVTRTPRS